MKKTFVLPMAMFFAGLAASAYAANVTFTPGSVDLTVDPGNAGMAQIQVNASSNTPTPMMQIDLQVGSQVVSGNLPASWLKPASVSLMSMMGAPVSSNMSLEIDVPANAAGGQYTAVLQPDVLNSTETVSSGNINVVVNVPSQTSCGDGPMLSNVKVGPTNIWAPTEKVVNINVSGNVTSTPGCAVTGTYTMQSNDGNVTGDLGIDATGNFALSFPIKVAKDAKTKAGTDYNGTLTVADADGNKVSQTFLVQVAHDRDK